MKRQELFHGDLHLASVSRAHRDIAAQVQQGTLPFLFPTPLLMVN